MQEVTFDEREMQLGNNCLKRYDVGSSVAINALDSLSVSNM